MDLNFRNLHFNGMVSVEISVIIAKYLDNGRLLIGIFWDLSKVILFKNLNHREFGDK